MSEGKEPENKDFLLAEGARLGQVRDELVRLQNLLGYYSEQASISEEKFRRGKVLCDVVERIATKMCFELFEGSAEKRKSNIYDVAVPGKELKLVLGPGFNLDESVDYLLGDCQMTQAVYQTRMNAGRMALENCKTAISAARSILSFDKTEMDNLPSGG
jgi:hypothetical protein